MEIKKERTLDGNIYFIRAFPAFAAANLSGEIASLIFPIIGVVVPLLGGKGEGESVLDMDAEKAAPLLAEGLSGINGDKIESLLKKLLIKQSNISVQIQGSENAVVLTEELANELFCGDVQDMFILAWDVIQANFQRIFGKVSSLFGSLRQDRPGIVQTFQNMAL